MQFQGRWLAWPALVPSPTTPQLPTTLLPNLGPRELLPVAVVQVLSDEGVGLHRPIGIHLRHVHVVNEVDQLLAPWGAIVSPCLLLQGLLQDSWQERRWRGKDVQTLMTVRTPSTSRGALCMCVETTVVPPAAGVPPYQKET